MTYGQPRSTSQMSYSIPFAPQLNVSLEEAGWDGSASNHLRAQLPTLSGPLAFVTSGQRFRHRLVQFSDGVIGHCNPELLKQNQNQSPLR